MEIENENDVICLCEECYQAQPLDIQIVIDAYTIGYKMAHKDPDFINEPCYYREKVKELSEKIHKYIDEEKSSEDFSRILRAMGIPDMSCEEIKNK